MTDIVSVETVTIESIEVGTQGPPGPRGEIGPAGGLAISTIAGEDLSGHRAVRFSNGSAYYCDADNTDHIGTCVGITLNAALTGANVDVQTMSEVTDPSFAFSEGPLFVGAMGVLSATPGTAFSQEIARATSATRLFLNIQPAIIKV